MAKSLEERNKEVLIRSLDLIMGKGGPELAEEVLAPDYLDHNAPEDRGPGRVLRIARQAREAFPDLKYDIEEVIAEGDIVAFRLRMEGTHQGPLPGSGLPGTGKRVQVRQLHMARVMNGKVAEHWAVRDDLGMLVQLGVFPPPGARPGGPAAREPAGGTARAGSPAR
jgi:predicted ester cyclase